MELDEEAGSALDLLFVFVDVDPQPVEQLSHDCGSQGAAIAGPAAQRPLLGRGDPGRRGQGHQECHPPNVPHGLLRKGLGV